ncbi:hypothetical protein BJV82DRAFT_93741 [Fennellomyces sp. T-0311]|nr:hypothetical protein BJV82DRAFT_93741 [Fennellomyces sp. T-0311]
MVQGILPLEKKNRWSSLYIKKPTSCKSSMLSLNDLLRPSTRPSVLDVNNLLSPAPVPLKAKRKRASPSQLSVLNRVFNQTFFPSTELRIELGKQLGMSPRTVQIWFQNKRQSIRTRDKIPRQRKKSSEATPPVSPPPLSPSGPITPPYTTASMHQMLPPPTMPPLLASSPTEQITLPPLRLPSQPCWLSPSGIPPLSTNFPSPTSIDAIIYRD